MPCRCGHYFARCVYCGRGGPVEPTRLELLARTAGVDPWELRFELHDRVEAGRRSRARAVVPRRPPSVPEVAFDVAGGDPLLALDLVLKVRADGNSLSTSGRNPAQPAARLAP